MKLKFLLFLLITLVIQSSCIKDELPYEEADIDVFNLPYDVMVTSVVSNNSIMIMVNDTTGFQDMLFTPEIKISPKAMISPAIGERIHFKDYKAQYTVQSESKKNTKIYDVEVVPFIPLKFDFDRWTTKAYNSKKSYPILESTLWDNANPGVAMVVPDDFTLYPSRSTEDSYAGTHAAYLETQPGVGSLAGMMNINLFAGSLFRGSFKLNIFNPLKSTRFGQSHPKYAGKPVKLVGYYKYTPGPNYQDRNKNIIAEKTDSCSIYAVMYKVTQGAAGRNEYLDGTNILDPGNGKLVGKALLQSSKIVSEYTFFELPFEYIEEIDYDNYDYKLAVVFSSSKNGDNYEGAIGSVLVVDEVEVVCVDYK